MITLRPLTLTDATKLFQIYSDKEAMKYRGSKPMESIDDAIDFVKTQSLKKDQTLTIRKAVELDQTKELIGSVMFRFYENQKHTCEIGYSIGRQFWGQGYGKEIVKTIIETFSQNKTIQELIAWSHQDNLASRKILTSLGFKNIEHQKENKLLLFKLIIID